MLMMCMVTSVAISANAQTTETKTATQPQTTEAASSKLEPGWHKLGQVRASFSLDKDQIMVDGVDRFTSIRLKATDAPIEIFDIEVHYVDGEREEIGVQQKLDKGESTRVIDLKGVARNIKKVVLIYKSIPNAKDAKTVVELFGKKAE